MTFFFFVVRRFCFVVEVAGGGGGAKFFLSLSSSSLTHTHTHKTPYLGDGRPQRRHDHDVVERRVAAGVGSRVAGGALLGLEWFFF